MMMFELWKRAENLQETVLQISVHETIYMCKLISLVHADVNGKQRNAALPSGDGDQVRNQ